MIFRIINKIRHIQNKSYSSLIKRGFFSVGKLFSVEYPARIIGGNYITIGNNFSSFGRLRLEAIDRHNGVDFQPSVIIGNGVSINTDCHIGCVNKIFIGDDVLIASRVFITDHFHGEVSKEQLKIKPSERIVNSPGPVIIEKNVWIGEGVVILPNVTIGENCIIGANAVVTKSFEANSIIAGVPANVIKVL